MGEIVNYMKFIFKELNVDGVKIIIFVGGFVKSNIVYDYIRNIFFDIKVIIFIDLDFVVLKGVVKFGRFEGIVEKRVCDYIYGVEINRYCLVIDLKDKIKRIGEEY